MNHVSGRISKEAVMTRIKNILVATDYSENARRAETRAAMLSVELNADRLEIMAVQAKRMGAPAGAQAGSPVSASSVGLAAEAEGELISMDLKPNYDGPHCVRTLKVGNPAAAVTDHAAQMHADLTVVAIRKQRVFPHLLAGSGHDDVIRLCSRPVLLVKHEPRSAYERVLVAVDFSEESEQAARVALAMAPSAHVTFVHACRLQHEEVMREAGLPSESIIRHRTRLCEQSQAQLNQFIAALGPRRQLISRTVQYGRITAVLREHASRMNADLIAVGKTGRSLPQPMPAGSVTKRLVGESACDLLVAPLPFVPEIDSRVDRHARHDVRRRDHEVFL
jgi:nucleotide-binding universal stress UspA family protein